MRKRDVIRGALIAAAAATAAAALLVVGGTLSFDRLPLPNPFSRSPGGSPSSLPAHLPDVAIVTIDAQSMRDSPHLWPWPRDRFAELVSRLDAAGARVVAFNLDFSRRYNRSQDIAFARAIKKSRHVVLAAHRELRNKGEAGEVEIARLPAPEFRIGAAALGHVLFDVDPDGVIRHGLRERRIAAQDFPSLSQAAVAIALGEDPVPHEASPFPIDYRRANPPFPTIPVADVLEGRFNTRDVAGRIVFVGATAARFQDLWTTPLGRYQTGVYIQALEARTLLAERVR